MNYLDINNYDYILDEELIAQSPSTHRTGSRLLVVNPETQTIVDKTFSSITDHLKPRDLLVINTSKVWRARLNGYKVTENGDVGAKIELLLFNITENNSLEFLAKPAKRCLPNGKIKIGEKHYLEVISKNDDTVTCDLFVDSVKCGRQSIIDTIQQFGEVPLPPYIKQKNDEERYQTVYAGNFGSSAAPTAGLHFDEPLIKTIKEMGVEFCEVELHVGPGTFLPVRTNDLSQHKMHSEHYFLSEQTAQLLNNAKKENRRIICVGTTSLRCIESNYRKHQFFKSENTTTTLFLHPPQKIESADALITNFHLPKSTLLILVSAFGGYEFIKKVYAHAVKNRYRFFSFGDAMFLETKIG